MNDIDTSRSYATEARLLQSLKELGITTGYIVVCNRKGRFTAVCSFGVHGAYPAHCGFQTMN